MSELNAAVNVEEDETITSVEDKVGVKWLLVGETLPGFLLCTLPWDFTEVVEMDSAESRPLGDFGELSAEEFASFPEGVIFDTLNPDLKWGKIEDSLHMVVELEKLARHFGPLMPA